MTDRGLTGGARRPADVLHRLGQASGRRAIGNVGRFVRASVRRSDRLAAVLLLRDWQSFIRSWYLLTASRLGLIEALGREAGRAGLVRTLGIRDSTQFDLFLQLGVALGELGVRGDRYRLRGARIKAMTGERGPATTAFLEEMLTYHGSVFLKAPERMPTSERGDYLGQFAETIARSSLVLEPVITEYLQAVVTQAGGPVQVLDAGCGSGAYLRAAAMASDGAHGAGIDVQPDSVALAARNLAEWGIADRFTVSEGDVRSGAWGQEGPFDVAFLINNVYYFTPAERVDVFRSLREALTPDGTLAVVSIFHGDSVTVLDLDFVLAPTVGCYPLAELGTVVAELREAGFTVDPPDRLVPGETLYGVCARPRTLPRDSDPRTGGWT